MQQLSLWNPLEGDQRIVRQMYSEDETSSTAVSMDADSFMSEQDLDNIDAEPSDAEREPCSHPPCLTVGGDSSVPIMGRALSWTLVGVMSTTVLLICFGQFGMSSKLPGHQGILEASEFDELLKVQSRKLLEQVHSPDDMEAHIETAVENVHTFLAEHLEEEDEHRMRNVKLTSENWRDLGMLCNAIRDERVQRLGKVVLQEVRQNILADPSEVGEKVLSQFGRNELATLSQELLPGHLRNALVHRWGSRVRDAEKHVTEAKRVVGATEALPSKIWHTMLDPLGNRFENLRRNASHIVLSDTDKDGSMSLAIGQRLLREGPWRGKFKLAAWEKATGITSIIFITAAEIMAHVDLLVPDMEKIPTWVEIMLFIPAYTFGTMDCIIGLSFWCDWFLGALGLNALDAIAVLSGLDLAIDSLHHSKNEPFE